MCYSPSLYYNGDILDVDEESELKASGEWDETKARWIHTLYSFNCNNEQYEGVYAAPTLQMAMKWLREVHKCYIHIAPFYQDLNYSEPPKWLVAVDANSMAYPTINNYFKTYEEACEAGIKYCLENLI